MEINQYLRDVILSNQDKINRGDFLDIYQKAFDLTQSYDCFQVCKFTEAMYSAEIDPLQYIEKVIPECFLFECQKLPENFPGIPDTCTSIWEQAFSGCVFDRKHEIVIPSTCLDIREYAFASSTIDKIEIECINKAHIWSYAFDAASIYQMWLNELPTAPDFISHVDEIKYLFLPTEDSEVVERWVQRYLSNIGKSISDKVEYIISSINGEVFFEWQKQ